MWNKKEKEVIEHLEEKLILRKAIDKAEKNGYKGHIRYLSTHINPTGDKKIDKRDFDKIDTDTLYFHGRAIVFSTDFIIAFFPKGEIDKERNIIKTWKYHTTEMLKTNPIRYIERYL